MGVAGNRARPEQQVWDSMPHGKPHRMKPPVLPDVRTGSWSLASLTREWGFCDPERHAPQAETPRPSRRQDWQL